MKTPTMSIWIVHFTLVVLTFYMFFFWWFMNGSMMFSWFFGAAVINFLLTPLTFRNKGGKS